ncbi:Protein phosphatase 1 regulatory subunit 14D [Manis javanica]|nr:Protein phosphatase 1 regulatory subunit 14D [Manis javanica]
MPCGSDSSFLSPCGSSPRKVGCRGLSAPCSGQSFHAVFKPCFLYISQPRQGQPKVSRSRRPSRLTVKYDRGQLQRWLETEQWVDAKVQELFQDQPSPSEPEIDLEALMELSIEEQKTQLEAILQNCPRPTEPFISELLSQLKKLRRLSRPQK